MDDLESLWNFNDDSMKCEAGQICEAGLAREAASNRS